jgi:hypothetical protein
VPLAPAHRKPPISAAPVPLAFGRHTEDANAGNPDQMTRACWTFISGTEGVSHVEFGGLSDRSVGRMLAHKILLNVIYY